MNRKLVLMLMFISFQSFADVAILSNSYKLKMPHSEEKVTLPNGEIVTLVKKEAIKCDVEVRVSPERYNEVNTKMEALAAGKITHEEAKDVIEAYAQYMKIADDENCVNEK